MATPHDLKTDQSEAPNSVRGIDHDVQRLIDAATGLAEATVRPLANVLRVLGDNVGGPQTRPQVRLHHLERGGTELLSAAVRLVENVANLSLQALGAPSRPSTPTRGASGSGPRVVAGDSLRLPLSVENPGASAMTDLRFELSPLTGPDGATIDLARAHITPDVLTVAPGDFEKLVVQVDVPEDCTPGSYEGALQLPNDTGFRVPVRFQVLAPRSTPA